MFQISRAERLEMIMKVVVALVQNPGYCVQSGRYANSVINQATLIVDAILESCGYDTENFY